MPQTEKKIHGDTEQSIKIYNLILVHMYYCNFIIQLTKSYFPELEPEADFSLLYQNQTLSSTYIYQLESLFALFMSVTVEIFLISKNQGSYFDVKIWITFFSLLYSKVLEKCMMESFNINVTIYWSTIIKCGRCYLLTSTLPTKEKE